MQFTTAERREALRDIRESRGGSDNWDMVSKWIHRMVRIEPTVMRAVAKAKFGNLGNWLEKNTNKTCGCLVGTTALELVKRRNHFTVDNHEAFYCEVEIAGQLPGDFTEPAHVVSALSQKADQDLTDRAGIAAMEIGEHLGQDRAVALIKSEIAYAFKRARADRKRKR